MNIQEGTVIRGTTKPEDLIPVFHDILWEITQKKGRSNYSL